LYVIAKVSGRPESQVEKDRDIARQLIGTLARIASADRLNKARQTLADMCAYAALSGSEEIET
jgi:hypothetical protein